MKQQNTFVTPSSQPVLNQYYGVMHAQYLMQMIDGKACFLFTFWLLQQHLHANFHFHHGLCPVFQSVLNTAKLIAFRELQNEGTHVRNLQGADLRCNRPMRLGLRTKIMYSRLLRGKYAKNIWNEVEIMRESSTLFKAFFRLILLNFPLIGLEVIGGTEMNKSLIWHLKRNDRCIIMYM